MPSFTVFKGSKNGTIIKATTTKPELVRDQVLVKVTAAGLCGTDMHYRDADIALGHEGVGLVEATGPGCRRLKKGDRVGWSYFHDSCGHCDHCLRGFENYCLERELYGEDNLDQGGFAEAAVWRKAFLVDLPGEMSDADAAPMAKREPICRIFELINSSLLEVVGVMGVGGLGHLAIQFAAKIGCHVVVLSGSDSKKEEAMHLGAKEFVVMRKDQEIKVSRRIDRLLVTTSAQLVWAKLLPILAPEVTLHPLSVAEGDFAIPNMPMILQGLTIRGTALSSRFVLQRMLEFAVRHHIKPITEKFPLTQQGLTEAMDKLEAGRMRYRGVLVRS